MDERPFAPKVSIGMPVFNGEQSIRAALDTLIGQSFPDFELIVSDNASTDGTEHVCREYAARDQRIRYIQQSTNLGAEANFKFVLDEAKGEYFMWAACDDARSLDFVELNIKFLSENPEYVASTCPNRYEGQSRNNQDLVRFALDGELFERFFQFFENCWNSHAMFYSLVRTKVLRDCETIGKRFFALDWAIILYLASKGKINRTKDGDICFGEEGISRGSDAVKIFQKNIIDFVLPLHRFEQYLSNLTTTFSPRQKFKLIKILLKLNLQLAIFRLKESLHSLWCAVRRAR